MGILDERAGVAVEVDGLLGAQAYSPAVIANYAYDLAKEFNQYYHDTPILKEENEDVLKMRLVLVHHRIHRPGVHSEIKPRSAQLLEIP